MEHTCPICYKIFIGGKKRIYCSGHCRNLSPYHSKRVSEGLKGNIPWNKGIKGYKTSWLGRKHSEETKNLMRQKHWSRTNIEGHRKHYFSIGMNKPTKYENMFANLLKKIGINFIPQVVINNKYQVDFLIGEKLVIEIDGKWHYKKGNLRLEDKNRDEILTGLGYIVEHIKNDEVEYYIGAY